MLQESWIQPFRMIDVYPKVRRKYEFQKKIEAIKIQNDFDTLYKFLFKTAKTIYKNRKVT